MPCLHSQIERVDILYNNLRKDAFVLKGGPLVAYTEVLLFKCLLECCVIRKALHPLTSTKLLNRS